MKVSEISEILNNWMPTSIAEDYDNVGLIVGNPDSLVTNILITLDTVSYTHLTLPTIGYV